MPSNENAASGAIATGSGGRRLTGWLRSLGPGIITAALVFGPSKITITSKLGAEYGYALLWIVAVAIFFMIVFTSMAARIGIATKQSLLSTIREKWGKVAAIVIGFGIFLVTASFQAGNSIGIGISLAELTHTSPVIWIVIFNLLAISLLFFRSFYKILEKIMILLICMILCAFVTTLLMIRPGFSPVLSGMVPTIPAGSLTLVIAFIASCFSIVGAFYQSYLVQERRRVNPGIRQSSRDSFMGMLILGIISSIVLICAAAILHPAGIKVNTATDMSKALEPLLGQYASRLFLCGLFGASFSALIGNSSAGGTLLGDALGFGSQLNSKNTRLLIALVMVMGASIAIIFGKLPIELIVFAQSVTILIVPFIGIAMYVVANDRRYMGALKNNTATRLIAGVGLLLLIILGVMSIKDMFFK